MKLLVQCIGLKILHEHKTCGDVYWLPTKINFNMEISNQLSQWQQQPFIYCGDKTLNYIITSIRTDTKAKYFQKKKTTLKLNSAYYSSHSWQQAKSRPVWFGHRQIKYIYQYMTLHVGILGILT